MLERFVNYIKTQPDKVSINVYSEPDVYNFLYKHFLEFRNPIFVLEYDSEKYFVKLNAESLSFTVLRIESLQKIKLGIHNE